ncbi:MAG: putative metal-dependent hydrolase [Chitinophagales bacterium]|nr:putative metal-dependent hydrolase [Chitinophagales bacterium]
MAIIKKTTTKPVKKNLATKKSVTEKVTPKKATSLKSVLKKTQAQKPKPVVKSVIQAEKIDPKIFPIGKFSVPHEYTDVVINNLTQELKSLPKDSKKVAKKIKSDAQLQASYRDGGWSIEQIIHHLADSHMNAFIRFKLSLTENNPVIKPYTQDLWAETADIQLPIKISIKLLKALHTKWVCLLENMDKNDFKRTYTHPEYKTTPALQEILAQYAWHGKHHLAQIELALKSVEIEKTEEEKKSKEIKSIKPKPKPARKH